MPNSKKNATPDKISDLSGAKIHFVGIGGVSMASLAELSIISGATVSGSDRSLGERTQHLVNMGAHIYAGHSGENVAENTDILVYSNAISEENPELQKAAELGIQSLSRARFLGSLMLDYACKIGVSGSHGKSTTTAMIDAIFSLAGRNPTTLSGEDLPMVKSPLRVGGKDTLIYEACEYKDAFLMFSPSIAVALNLEMDHVDYYKDEKALKNSFVKALSLASGFVLLNEDDENLFKIEKRISSRVITFSANRNSDYHYEILSFAPGGYSFSIKKMGKTLGIFRLPILGAFNVTNAAAAAIVAIECGIPTPIIAEALKSFGGVKRRLEHIGTHHGRHLIYDYAHHPTEIRASINTIRMAYPGEITVIFKPHTFTRTEYFWRDFVGALQLADHVVVTDIYPARERPIAGVSSEKLAQAIGPRAIYSKENELLSAIDLHTYGTIILMGAGDLEDIKSKLLHAEHDDHFR